MIIHSTIMIQKLFRRIQIYNISILLSVFLLSVPVLAQDGLFDVINKTEVLKNADLNFAKGQKETDKSLQEGFLKQAQSQYYTVFKLEQNNTYPLIQLARINDLLNNDKYAKSYFTSALGVNYKDINANLYFGDFYYKRENYRMALKYYRKAFEYGLDENFDILFKMAVIYEKLGDLSKSNLYYKKSFLLNAQDTGIPDKIRSIEQVKYQNTGYYKRNSK